jgi:hypothetical protein
MISFLIYWVSAVATVTPVLVLNGVRSMGTANLSPGVDFSSRIGVSWRWRIHQSVQAPSGQTSRSSNCFHTVDLSGTRFARSRWQRQPGWKLSPPGVHSRSLRPIRE